MSWESGTVIHDNALSGGAPISISIRKCITIDREKRGGNLRAGFASSAPFLVSFLMRNFVKKKKKKKKKKNKKKKDPHPRWNFSCCGVEFLGTQIWSLRFPLRSHNGAFPHCRGCHL